MRWLIDTDREAAVRADDVAVREMTVGAGTRRSGCFGLGLTDGSAKAVCCVVRVAVDVRTNGLTRCTVLVGARAANMENNVTS